MSEYTTPTPPPVISPTQAQEPAAANSTLSHQKKAILRHAQGGMWLLGGVYCCLLLLTIILLNQFWQSRRFPFSGEFWGDLRATSLYTFQLSRLVGLAFCLRWASLHGYAWLLWFAQFLIVIWLVVMSTGLTEMQDQVITLYKTYYHIPILLLLISLFVESWFFWRICLSLRYATAEFSSLLALIASIYPLWTMFVELYQHPLVMGGCGLSFRGDSYRQQELSLLLAWSGRSLAMLVTLCLLQSRLGYFRGQGVRAKVDAQPN
ncbi:MAG: hypothetical protein SFX18_07670 [Pirellulales bacterium]|nr:hypothetical protein [Pirellulales bacterium]